MPKKSSLNIKLFLIISVTSIIDLILLLYTKYKNQNLTLSYFSFENTGNGLNIAFTVFLILGIFIYTIFNENTRKSNLLFSATVIKTIFLGLGILTTTFTFSFLKDRYLLDHQFSEVLTGVFFVIFQIIQLLIIMIIYLSIFNVKNYLFIKSFVSAILILSLIFVWSFFNSYKEKNDYQEIGNSNIRKDNIAVILGAAVWRKNNPSPTLKSRIDKAIELYNYGYADKLQVTGGNAPGELSEAETAFNYLISKNIDSTDIFVENRTTSTKEQVQFIYKNLSQKNNIIIVSDGYHLPRIDEISKFYNVKIYFAASNLTLSFENKMMYKIRESLATVAFWLFGL